MPTGGKLLITVFLFTAAFSPFHLAKNVATPNIHLIMGRTVLTPASVLLPDQLVRRHPRLLKRESSRSRQLTYLQPGVGHRRTARHRNSPSRSMATNSADCRVRPVVAPKAYALIGALRRRLARGKPVRLKATETRPVAVSGGSWCMSRAAATARPFPSARPA